VMSVGASNAAWLAPGCRLDRYDLLLQIAEGGMGLLWLARQQGKHGFDKIVALKTILPKLASDPGFRQMFLDEARVVSRIEHPNVAQVLDLGEERGVLFLVMKWIDGESLTNVGRAAAGETDARIPVGILTRVMVDVCAGLHAAHELMDDDGRALGVVHRDVSPHNFLVGFSGTTKVIDFGIAKARNRLAQDTSIGLLKGKIHYMAPEQAMGNEVDRRTDVWSAGASMYRFLAGHVPYSASEPLAVLRRIAEGLPPTRLPTTVPEPIRFVVERALDPDARKRFVTAHDMGTALETAMRAADIYATREDVAAFMAEHLGEARAIRTREIENAVRESRARMRVELAHTENASEPALPIAQNDLANGLPVLSAESSDESFVLESRSEGPPRPSRHPTVILPASQQSIRLDYAAAGAADVPADACEAPRTPPREAIDSERLSAGTRGGVPAPTAAVSVPLPVRRRASRPLVQWITGTCLLGVLLVGGFAWRAAQPSRPIGATDVAASPTRLPGPPETSTLLPAGGAGVQATVSTPVPPAPVPMPASASPKEQRASATPPVEPSVPDRGSAGDLLERARRARRAGRIGDAAALFAAAVEKAPTDSEALTGLAEVDEAQGATTKAIVDYRHAVAVNPRYLPARLGLADSLWTNGQRDEARTAYRSIVSQFPTTLCPDLARERAAGTAGNAKTPK
jgi:serine/threonine protein kinase